MEVFIVQLLSIVIFQTIFLQTLNFSQDDCCPDHTTLGPRTSDGKSMCAIVYTDTSCKGPTREVYNGEAMGSLDGLADNSISSLVVREGCTLTGYGQSNYGGRDKTFQGAHATLGDWDDDITSFKCKCDFNPVECVPFDYWVDINTCDNPTDTRISCEYAVEQGIIIGDDISNGKSLSKTETSSIGLELKKLFEKSPQFNTDYDWYTSNEFTKIAEPGLSFVDYVDPGKRRVTKQVHGKCGDSVIKSNNYHTTI